MNEQEGIWRTINGRRIFIRINQSPMDAFIRQQGGSKISKDKVEIVDDKYKEKQNNIKNRFDNLKKDYPDAYYEKYNGIERLTLPLNTQLADTYIYGKNYKTTTQSELNQLPLRLTIYGEYGQSSIIYKNKSQMIKDITYSYGGLNQMTDNGKNVYSISSEGGIGEFYLKRDKFAKGGWTWLDVNGEQVNGSEIKSVRGLKD